MQGQNEATEVIDIFIDGRFQISLDTRKRQEIIDSIEDIVDKDIIMDINLTTNNRVQVKTIKGELENEISQVSKYNE